MEEYPHIWFCLQNGVMRRRDVLRLVSKLIERDRITLLAREFDMDAVAMAYAAFDAGLCFLRLALLTQHTGQTFSPPPIPDEGWDIMADHETNPDEEAFYAAVCGRLCEVLGVSYYVPEHTRITWQEALVIRDMSDLHGALRARRLEFVEEHWPVAGSGSCTPGGVNPCIPMPPGRTPTAAQ